MGGARARLPVVFNPCTREGRAGQGGAQRAARSQRHKHGAQSYLGRRLIIPAAVLHVAVAYHQHRPPLRRGRLSASCGACSERNEAVDTDAQRARCEQQPLLGSQITWSLAQRCAAAACPGAPSCVQSSQGSSWPAVNLVFLLLSELNSKRTPLRQGLHEGLPS